MLVTILATMENRAKREEPIKELSDIGQDVGLDALPARAKNDDIARVYKVLF